MARLRAPTPRGKRLRIGRANAGNEAAYRKRLRRLIRQMHGEVINEITRLYRHAEPSMAQDASPFARLVAALTRLRTKWLRIFNEEADNIAERFVHAASNDTHINKKILFLYNYYGIRKLIFVFLKAATNGISLPIESLSYDT